MEENNDTLLNRLIDNEWLYKVNAISHKTTEDNRRNRSILLPNTGDLIKPKEHIETEIEAAKPRPNDEKSMNDF